MKQASFPEDFDSTLLELLDEISTTLTTLDASNIEEVTKKIDDIKEKIKAVEGVNSAHKVAAIAGASVAGESTKLWTSAYTDPKHSLSGLHHGTYYKTLSEEEKEHHHERRKLGPCTTSATTTTTDSAAGEDDDGWVLIPGIGWVEVGSGSGGPGLLMDRFDIIDIIQADIDGAVVGVLEVVSVDPVLALIPVQIFVTGFTSAVAYSAAWALNPPTAAPVATPSAAPIVQCTGAPVVTTTSAPVATTTPGIP